METKNLQQIAKEKLQANNPTVPATATMNIQSPEQFMEGEKPNSLPPNHIINITKALKERQTRDTVWFEFELPSNGKCGYPKEIKLRELTTSDEKTLIKEMFSSKENSILNVIRKCARFESLPDFDFEKLTTFDQDFIILELSAITFPGEKIANVTDDAGHKLKIKLEKEDLTLSKVPDNMEYPFKVEIPSMKMSWYLNFMTLKKLKEIEKALKDLSNDVLNRVLISISLNTAKIEINGKNIEFDNFYEVVKLLDSFSPADLKIILDFYNDKTATAYGYKLVKDYYCADCAKEGTMELEPLQFFRITI